MNKIGNTFQCEPGDDLEQIFTLLNKYPNHNFEGFSFNIIDTSRIEINWSDIKFYLFQDILNPKIYSIEIDFYEIKDINFPDLNEFLKNIKSELRDKRINEIIKK